jgi:hypothetical protein
MQHIVFALHSRDGMTNHYTGVPSKTKGMENNQAKQHEYLSNITSAVEPCPGRTIKLKFVS